MARTHLHTRWPSSPALAASLLALAWIAPGTALARERIVFGGSALSAYVYSGEPESNVFAEGVAHDARFELGGLFAYDLRRARHELTAAVFGGAVIAARFADYRAPLVRALVNDTLRFGRRLELHARLRADLAPVSATDVSGQSLAGDGSQAPPTVGRLALTVQPGLDATLRIDRRDTIESRLRLQIYTLLADHDQLEQQQVAYASGIQLEASFRRQLTRVHAVSATVLGRLMESVIGDAGAPAALGTPSAVLVGGMAGYRLSWTERWQLNASAGVGKVLNYPASHLAPVEPLVRIEGSWRDRLQLVQATFNWTVHENVYGGGLPQRTAAAAVSYQRQPSWHSWRWVTELAYEHNSFAEAGGIAGERLAHDVHTLRLRGRVFWSFARRWQLIGEVASYIGMVAGEVPGCGGAGEAACPPERGVHLSTMVGVAYLHRERAQDELLLQEVW